MYHKAGRTSAITTKLRSNVDVAKNSRIANRYTMPAIVKEAMKYGPPLSPKLREQIVSATHNVAPSMYSLHEGVSFTALSGAGAGGASVSIFCNSENWNTIIILPGQYWSKSSCQPEPSR